MVYNLPEAIRESDLEKLSFAVELSKAFYSVDAGANASSSSNSSGASGGVVPVQPGNMVWLIQRDFLQVCARLSGPGEIVPRPPLPLPLWHLFQEADGHMGWGEDARQAGTLHHPPLLASMA